MQVVGKTEKSINRKIHIDFLRILAAFLVIYNHTLGFDYYLSHTNEPYKIVVCIALSSLTRINVPLFFLISGALLLEKEESYRTLFSKRIVRFCLVLIGASALAYGSTHFLYKHDLSLQWFIRALVSGQISTPYWFLYAYLGFLFALPFLRKLAKHLNWQDIVMLIVFQAFFSSLVSMCKYITGYLGYDPVSFNGSFTQPFAMSDILFYPLVGYYLEHQVPTEKYGKKEVALLLGVLAGGIGLSTAFTYHQGTFWTGFSQSYLGIFVSLSAISVFLLMKIACNRMRETGICLWLGEIAGRLSGLTLGIFLLDPIFKSVFAERILAPAGDSLYLIPFSVIYCCISMAVCGAITRILKWLPVTRHLL